MLPARHHQGVDHRTIIGNPTGTVTQQCEFVIQETDIERSIVNYQLGVTDKCNKFIRNICSST